MRIYVAGPLTSGDWYQNVRWAIDTANEITALTGHQCFVPHLSLTWELIHHHDYEWWMKWCLAWVEACDGLFRQPGKSAGADREVEHARGLGIPVFETFDALMRHVWHDPPHIDAIHHSPDLALSTLLQHPHGTMHINDDGEFVVSWRQES